MKGDKREKLLKMIPDEGFIKTTSDRRASLSPDQRSALIRKGNELFNQGKYDVAKRIFITTGYSDGLIRLGDLYYKKHKCLEAFRMWSMAPHKKKVNYMVESMAWIVRSWLKESKEGK